MKFSDLLLMSINNLRRRKLRTVLTVLGVVIGTASIVVMVSLGIGLNEMTVEQIASYGSLTTIDVSSPDMGGYYAADSSSKRTEPLYLTDEMMEKFSRIPHVTGVSPILQINIVLRQGVWEAEGIQLRGVNRSYLEQIKLGNGRFPESGELALFPGNGVIQQFVNMKTGKGYWELMELPDVDLLGKPLFVIYDVNAYMQSRETGGFGDGDNAARVVPPKKYLIECCGQAAGGEDEWNSYSWYVFTDIEGLKEQLRKVFRKGTPIPGQPLNKKGKPLNYLVYNGASIFVDDMENVQEVQKTVAEMGFHAESNMEWLESSRKQSGMVQAVLGGIGAVSLFVAAIGIANTMMMSIYERTKEIGVMKVLGCDMGNIRNMFLLESGFIGFMGGMTGILLSYGISALINHFTGMSGMLGGSGNLSRIPFWLSGSAIVFAIFVGMAAGFLPAMRAMRLSPLAAIRNE